jgi:hypothetical protein
MSEKGGDETERGGISPAVSYGLGAFFVLNIAMLASLPPVLRGRGAPYLPTFRTHREAMFRQLQQTVGRKKEVFVDLGSGDGRLVFAAAQTFRLSVGYESNPFLYIFSQGQRFVRGPKYWASTRFYWQDLWTADLGEVDVVAVVSHLYSLQVVSSHFSCF